MLSRNTIDITKLKRSFGNIYFLYILIHLHAATKVNQETLRRSVCSFIV